jgi:predicted porin
MCKKLDYSKIEEELMKKATCLLFAMATTSGAALAQTNVQLYGLLDQALEYNSHSNAKQNSLVRMKSGGMNTSRFGLRGSEDLGGGLKAVFQLESGIQIDTGSFDDPSALFNRQANVGFEGAFGRVVMGRSFSTTYDFVLPYDPMGYAPLYSWATSSNASPPVDKGTVRKDGMLTGVSNMIKYQGKFGPMRLGAAYALGEEAGNSSRNAKYDFAAAYEEGPLGLVATYDIQNGATATNGNADKTKTIHLGASYQIGNTKLYAAARDYRRSLASGAPELRSSMYWAGASYQATPALTLTGVLYYQNIKDVGANAEADPKMLVARARYALSKRTDLYAVMAYAKAKNGLNVSVSRDDAGFSSNQTGVALGVQHRF